MQPIDRRYIGIHLSSSPSGQEWGHQQTHPTDSPTPTYTPGNDEPGDREKGDKHKQWQQHQGALVGVVAPQDEGTNKAKQGKGGDCSQDGREQPGESLQHTGARKQSHKRHTEKVEHEPSDTDTKSQGMFSSVCSQLRVTKCSRADDKACAPEVGTEHWASAGHATHVGTRHSRLLKCHVQDGPTPRTHNCTHAHDIREGRDPLGPHHCVPALSNNGPVQLQHVNSTGGENSTVNRNLSWFLSKSRFTKLPNPPLPLTRNGDSSNTRLPADVGAGGWPGG